MVDKRCFEIKQLFRGVRLCCERGRSIYLGRQQTSRQYNDSDILQRFHSIRRMCPQGSIACFSPSSVRLDIVLSSQVVESEVTQEPSLVSGAGEGHEGLLISPHPGRWLGHRRCMYVTTHAVLYEYSTRTMILRGFYEFTRGVLVPVRVADFNCQPPPNPDLRPRFEPDPIINPAGSNFNSLARSCGLAWSSARPRLFASCCTKTENQRYGSACRPYLR